jgi:SPP1 gp7 family putative phage head morphogenesis protein
MATKTTLPDVGISSGGRGKSVIPAKEVASAKLDYKRYQSYIKQFRNPDPILNNTKEGKEKGIQLFADMKRDCHIASCLERLTQTVTRYPFAVTPAGETQQDLDAAEFLHGQVKKHYFNLITFILDAIAMGYSVSEFWSESKGLAEMSKLKKRRQERFSFDENGDLLMRTEANQNGEAIPQEGFIVATYREEDNNKFGEGILSDCFWPWWFKKNGMLFWANALERFNQPIAVGTFPAGTKEEKQDLFLEALESIQSDYALIIPEGWKTELVKAMDSGAFTTFENFQGFLDRAISKRILGAAVNEGEQKFGSKGSNETTKDISDERIEAAAEFAVSVINEILFPRFCSWNFTLEKNPEFSILYKNKKLTKEQVDTVKVLADMGMPVPVDEINDAQGWKTPEPDDLVLYKGKLIAYKEIPGENVKIIPGNTPTLPVSFAETDAVESDPSAEPVASDKTVIADGKLVDDVFAGAADELRAAYDEKQLIGLVDKAGDYVSASKALTKYKPKNLEGAWRDVIELGRWLGEYSLAQQTAGGQFAEPEVKVDEAFQASFRKFTPTQAIAWLKGKIPVTKKVYDQLDAAAKNAAFYVAGLEDIEMINAMREKMIQALEKGIPYEQFARDLKMASGADPFFSNMKTAFYTNIHQAMAAQDYEALERIKDIVPYRRYSAILDSHTRPEHAKWHNFVAPADDPIWDYLYSLLMDYNCRCRITACPESDYNRLADSSAEQRGNEKYPTYETNPTQMNSDKLKELLKLKKEYADYLDGKLGSWAKIMAKIGGKI